MNVTKRQRRRVRNLVCIQYSIVKMLLVIAGFELLGLGLSLMQRCPVWVLDLLLLVGGWAFVGGELALGLFLPDTAEARLAAANVAPWFLVLLLAHGDALCTDDLAYQAYRRQVRDPAWQAGFLAQPLAARKAFIASLRQKSEAAKAEKAMEIMDVNADAVAALLRAHGYPTLVHGHTHRPDCHRFQLDGRDCVRHVLADWHGAARWLAFDGTRFTTDGASAAA